VPGNLEILDHTLSPQDTNTEDLDLEFRDEDLDGAVG
jgi:hypothetical protein